MDNEIDLLKKIVVDVVAGLKEEYGYESDRTERLLDAVEEGNIAVLGKFVHILDSDSSLSSTSLLNVMDKVAEKYDL